LKKEKNTIEVKKEKKNNIMKIIYTLIFLISFTFGSTSALAETERDCSQYSSKTFAGLSDKIRCKRGLPPREDKSIFNILKFKGKKSDKTTVENKKSCDEYSTKTVAGLVKKLRCKEK
tara:strand:+ start:5971 stop:6324 length:354 start_codon:yes stop_codon:yes gene_type:complete